MGLINTMMHRSMRKQAKKVVEIAVKNYDIAKKDNPDLSEEELYQAAYFINFDKKGNENQDEQVRNKVKICSKTLNGFCYIKGIDIGDMSICDESRRVQFTVYVDLELEQRGFPKLTDNQKVELLEAMNLPIRDWKEIVDRKS